VLQQPQSTTEDGRRQTKAHDRARCVARRPSTYTTHNLGEAPAYHGGPCCGRSSPPGLGRYRSGWCCTWVVYCVRAGAPGHTPGSVVCFGLSSPIFCRGACHGARPAPRTPHLGGGGGGAGGSPRAICTASSTYQKEDQMKDPRKLWGLSNACPREQGNSSLSKAKCFDITTLTPKNYRRSFLPSGPRPGVVLVP
jgi:hypothetical protein